MSARNHSKSSANASLDEDRQERGLRILGRLIAQHLIKRCGGYDDKTCNQKKDDLQPSEDPA
jgi:hypothetical protein